MRASERRSRSPSTTSAICDSRIGTPILRATMMRPKSFGVPMRPSTRTIASALRLATEPTGTATLALLSALTTWSTVSPSAVRRAASTRTWIWRVTVPPSATRPTPFTRSRPFCTTCSASVVSARALSVSPTSA